MLRAEDHYFLFERAAPADPDATTFPLRVGVSVRSGDYGPFGFAWKSAPTLRGSYDRACLAGTAFGLQAARIHLAPQ